MSGCIEREVDYREPNIINPYLSRSKSIPGTSMLPATDRFFIPGQIPPSRRPAVHPLFPERGETILENRLSGSSEKPLVIAQIVDAHEHGAQNFVGLKQVP